MSQRILKTICEEIRKYKDKIFWIRDEATDEDIQHILREATTQSPFDPEQLKKKTLEDLRAGKAKLVTRRSKYAKVLAIVYPGQHIPWDTFSKIFIAFGPQKKPWRILWFANPTKRIVYEDKEPGPSEINGGYTLPCRHDSIVIYREEEVSRVLIHELLHAACTDNMSDAIELREAKTETWAEIFLVAIQSNGNYKKAKELWELQAQWISNQEAALRKIGVVSPKNYCWRYSVSRRSILDTWGISLPESQPIMYPFSLRLTHPSI